MNGWHLATETIDSGGIPLIESVRTLTDDEFTAVDAAQATLYRILNRVVWQVLQHNYASLRGLGDHVAMLLARAHLSVRTAQDASLTVAVAMMANFVLVMRIYVDRSRESLAEADQEDRADRCTAWERICSAEYDDYFAYRFLSQLRNFVVHADLPISAFEIRQELSSITQQSTSQHLITRLFLGELPERLMDKSKKWNAAMKRELPGLSEPIDLLEQADIAMECLHRVERAFVSAFRDELRRAAESLVGIVGAPDDHEGDLIVTQMPSGDHGRHFRISRTEIDLDRMRLALQI